MKTKIQANTIIISDIHLGSDLCRSKKLIEVLKKYNFHRLIIAGDGFDSHNLTRIRHSHFSFLEMLSDLTGHKKKVEVVWVRGNHDEHMLNIVELIIGHKCPEKYEFEINDQKYLVMHGHQFDNLIIKYPILTEIICGIYYYIQKMDKKQKFSRKLKVLSKKVMKNKDQIFDRVKDYAKKHNLYGYNIVFGHTHMSYKKEEDGITFLNAGCWTDIPSSMIVIKDDGANELILVE